MVDVPLVCFHFIISAVTMTQLVMTHEVHGTGSLFIQNSNRPYLSGSQILGIC